jgi:hypothetical protein
MNGAKRERHINIIAAFLTDCGLDVTDFAGKHRQSPTARALGQWMLMLAHKWKTA